MLKEILGLLRAYSAKNNLRSWYLLERVYNCGHDAAISERLTPTNNRII